MIATDLDGTLLGPDSEVSERTCAAVAAAADAGIEIVAATGRSRLTALDKLAGCPAIRWVVCSNGAMVWDREHDVMHLHRPIAGADAAALIAGLAEHGDPLGFAWETADGFGFDDLFGIHRPSDLVLPGAAMLPGPDVDVTKVLVSHAELVGHDLYLHLAGHVRVELTVTSSGGPFIEATALGVDKASTLALVAEAMGIDASEVMAFGDQHNDLPMLTWAGTSVAMGNAHPDVAAASTMVAATNADHGVAQVIESLLHG